MGMEPVTPKDNVPKSSAKKQTILFRANAGVLGYSIGLATRMAAAGLIKLDLVGTEHIEACKAQGRPIIFAGWHGHNFLTMCAYYHGVRFLTKGAILVPDSLNGSMMHRIGKALDLQVVQVKPGSGSSGWARATVSMIKLLRSGTSGLLSPDGPSGSAYRAKPGIGVIAQQAKAVIIPASAAASPALRLRQRWDDHLLPLPFSKAVVRFGEPIDAAPTNAPQPTGEQLRIRIEEALIAGALEAERIRKYAAGKEK